MYKCNHCDKVFEEPMKKTYDESIECWGRKETYKMVEPVCPICGDENIEEFEYYEDEFDEENYIETDGEYEEDE